MFATKIAKLLYRNRKIDEDVYKDVDLWIVSSVFGGSMFAGQTIGECIFMVEGYTNEEGLLRHEYIHVKQWRRLGSLGFPIIYGWEFLKNYVSLVFSGFKGNKRVEAYKRISLEKEAGL